MKYFYKRNDEDISQCPCNLSDVIPIPTAVACRFVSGNWSEEGKHIGMIEVLENLLSSVSDIPINNILYTL